MCNNGEVWSWAVLPPVERGPIGYKRQLIFPQNEVSTRWHSGMWHVACGVWRVACGVWRVVCGVWRVACGVWHAHTMLFDCDLCGGDV
jgi:hypothetical protein